MIDPLLAFEIAKTRYEEQVREAEIGRLTRRIAPDEPRVRARILLKVADAMILFGAALRARYEPVPR